MMGLCCSCPHWGASEEVAWSFWAWFCPCVRSLAVPSLRGKRGMKNWMDVWVGSCPYHFFSHCFPNYSLPSAPRLLFFVLLSWNAVVELRRGQAFQPEGLFWNNYFLHEGGYVKTHLSQLDRQSEMLAAHVSFTWSAHTRYSLRAHLNEGPSGVLSLAFEKSGLADKALSLL